MRQRQPTADTLVETYKVREVPERFVGPSGGAPLPWGVGGAGVHGLARVVRLSRQKQLVQEIVFEEGSPEALQRRMETKSSRLSKRHGIEFIQTDWLSLSEMSQSGSDISFVPEPMLDRHVPFYMHTAVQLTHSTVDAPKEQQNDFKCYLDTDRLSELPESIVSIFGMGSGHPIRGWASLNEIVNPAIEVFEKNYRAGVHLQLSYNEGFLAIHAGIRALAHGIG